MKTCSCTGLYFDSVMSVSGTGQWLQTFSGVHPPISAITTNQTLDSLENKPIGLVKSTTSALWDTGRKPFLRCFGFAWIFDKAMLCISNLGKLLVCFISKKCIIDNWCGCTESFVLSYCCFLECASHLCLVKLTATY